MKFFGRKVPGGKRRRVLVVASVFPIFAWGVLNLFFLTATGRGIVEKKISERFRVECRIGGLSWSPWAGVTISEVSLLPPEGCGQEEALAVVDEIALDLSWLSLAAGEKRWDRLEVHGVRVNLSVEALRAVMARFEAPVPVRTEVPQETDQRLTQEETPEEPEERPEDQVREAEKTAQKSEEKADEVDFSPVQPVDDFEGVVVFADVNFRFFSLRAPELAVVVERLEGEVPLWGGERQGRVEVGEVRLAAGSEELSESALSLPVVWRDREVVVDSGVMKVFGLDLRARALVRMAPGFPFGIQIDLPNQDLDFSPFFQRGPSPLEISGLRSRTVLQGYLLSPAAFAGNHASRFEALEFHDLTDGGETRFERGQAVVRATAAGVVMQDCRAIGDEDAILMNGFATFGGEAAATVRIVSSPERARSHEKRVRGTGRRWSLNFEPLVTPDRLYRDLRLEWRAGEWVIDLGEEGDWVAFWPALREVVGGRNTDFSTGS